MRERGKRKNRASIHGSVASAVGNLSWVEWDLSFSKDANGMDLPCSASLFSHRLCHAAGLREWDLVDGSEEEQEVGV